MSMSSRLLHSSASSACPACGRAMPRVALHAPFCSAACRKTVSRHRADDRRIAAQTRPEPEIEAWHAAEFIHG